MPTDEELRIASAARRGVWAHFPDPAVGPPIVPVEATFLRALLLGEHGAIRCVKLRNAVIQGCLDLRDCVGVDGVPLAPLLLHDCTLHGAQHNTELAVLDASDAKLSRVSLSGSRVGVIDVSRARVDGDLELDGIQPLGERDCQLVAPRCKVTGSISLRGAHLRIPAGKRTVNGDRPDFAVFLREATIEGSLVLQPDVKLDGGLTLTDARVRGGVWANGIRLTASNEDALEAQRLVSEGAVVLGIERPEDASSHATAIGSIDLCWSQIGFIDLSGLVVEPGPRKEQAAQVNLAAAQIGNGVRMIGLRATSVGMSSATLGGDLVASDLTLVSDKQQEGAFYAINTRVGGDVTLSGVGRVASVIGMRVEHDFFVSGWSDQGRDPSELRASNVSVGNDCTLYNVNGAINMELAKVEGKLMINSAQLTRIEANHAVVRGTAMIAGALEIRSKQDGVVLDGGKYGALEILNLSMHLSPTLAGTQDCVTIQDATIERHLQLRQLTAFAISNDDWNRSPPSRSEARAVSFYPGATLVEVEYVLESGKTAVGSFLLFGNGTQVPLFGSSLPIHEANPNHLKLTDDASAKDYIRFFCAYVWGPEGPFRIIESDSELASPNAAITPVTVTRNEQGWTARACVAYGGELFGAEFSLSTNGTLEMTDDDPLRTTRLNREFSFTPPSRVAVSNAAKEKPFWLAEILPEGPTAPPPPVDHFMRLLRAKEEERPRATTAPTGFVRISLRGLRAASFDFDRRRPFHPQVLIDLDAFTYERLEKGESRSEQFREAGTSDSTSTTAAQASPWEGLEAQCLALLRQQYPTGRPIGVDQYSPQPYEQLARALRTHGWYDVSRRVMLEKLSEEGPFHKLWYRPISFLMGVFFEHGIFARRSVALFFLCWACGTVFFDFANQGRLGVPFGFERSLWLRAPKLERTVLVVESSPVSSLALESPRATRAVATQLVTNPADTAAEIPCGDMIEPAVYALDVMVPFLDLHHETRCSITSRDEAWPWRWLATAYAVGGGFISSMMLLTVSGLLRRRAEQ